LGYDVDKLPVMHQQELDGSGTSGVLSKKKRASDSGSESDWDYLLLSGHHRALGHGLACLLGLQPVEAVGLSCSPPPVPQINSSAILFSSIPLIVLSLHLLYEVCNVITPKCILAH
jgi:anaphase-promoting complex subunit 1